MSEDKCKRCGQCCMFKIDIFGVIMQSQRHCVYLKYNEQEKKYYCEVYNKRFEMADYCRPVEQAIKAGLVPETCGYVEGTEYKNKIKGNINIRD